MSSLARKFLNFSKIFIYTTQYVHVESVRKIRPIMSSLSLSKRKAHYFQHVVIAFDSEFEVRLNPTNLFYTIRFFFFFSFPLSLVPMTIPHVFLILLICILLFLTLHI